MQMPNTNKHCNYLMVQNQSKERYIYIRSKQMRPHRTRYTLGIIGLHVVILTMVCIPDLQRLGQEGRGIVESEYMELG